MKENISRVSYFILLSFKAKGCVLHIKYLFFRGLFDGASSS